jgi:1,2-phenylacetyl-CoA epoxidase catalytic subunit
LFCKLDIKNQVKEFYSIFHRYRHWGLKRRANVQAREEYIRETDPLIRAMGLRVPDPSVGREFV